MNEGLHSPDHDVDNASAGQALWQACTEQLSQELPTQQFNTWIRPLSVEAVDGGFRLLAPNRFDRELSLIHI